MVPDVEFRRGKGGSVALAATMNILRHPFDYLGACWRRVAYLVSFHPLLYLCGLAAVWISRKREGHGPLVVLLAYFIGIHCSCRWIGAISSR